MRNRMLCMLACLVVVTSQCAVARSMATLPPYVSPSALAPTAELERRMLLPDPRIEKIVQIAHNGETVGLVAQTQDGISTLWLYSAVQGTFALRYEAPMGYQIISPLFFKGDCYWAQWRNESSQGWEIMALRSDTDRIECIRADSYAASTMAPTLRTDGSAIYWYETDQPAQEDTGLLPVQLYCLRDGGMPTPLFSLQINDDGSGPSIAEGILAVGRQDARDLKWTIVLFSVDTRETLSEYAIQARPMDIQVQDGKILWLEGEASEAEMGRAAALEEEDSLYAQDRAWAFNGRLMLLQCETETVQVIDSDVEQAILLPFGIVYVNRSGMLYCYSFLLDQPIRLSAAGEYQPVMDCYAEELLVIRKIWTGEETLYRPEVLNLHPLSKGWPDLQ